MGKLYYGKSKPTKKVAATKVAPTIKKWDASLTTEQRIKQNLNLT